MAKIIGARIAAGFGKETTRGTAVAPTFWIPWVNFTFDDKVQKYTSQEALGVLDDAAEEFVGERWGEGDFEGEIRDKSFGLLLYALFGTVNSAVKETTAYNHTFTISQTNQHQSLTVAIDDPNTDLQFPLVMIEKLALDIILGQLVRYNATFISKGSESSNVSKSITVENKFVPTQVTIKLASTRAGLAAASAVKVQSLKLNVMKNLKRKHFLGSLSPDDIINQAIGIEGTFELPYEDQTYRNYMLNQTYMAMSIDILNTGVTIGATSNPRLQIIFPRCSFRDWTPNRPKGELYEQVIGFKAMRDVTNSEDLMYQTILTNTQTSY